MRSVWQPAAVGALLAGLTIAAVRWLPYWHGLELLATILVAAAVYYVGVAAGRDRAALPLELTLGLVFSAAALVGLWYSPAVLGAGYVLHAGWDALHHPPRAGVNAGPWFPPFCLVYDVAVGIFIFARFL